MSLPDKPRALLVAAAAAFLAIPLGGCLVGPRQEMKRNNYIDDLVVAARVKDALAREGGDAFSGIQVSVEKGKPVLRGAVGAFENKERAEQIARQASGSGEVKNEIQVRG
jgi:osmotically-inducible protein OsmY